MTIFAWQLTILAVVVLACMVPVLRFIQRRQLQAYDNLRDAVGSTMGEVSESLMGAATIRAYGLGTGPTPPAGAVRGQYRATCGRTAGWPSSSPSVTSSGR